MISADSFKADDIYYLIDQTKVPQSLIKTVEVKEDVAKITMHSSFVAGTTYYLNVANADDLSFVGAGHELKDVDTIKITMTKAYKEQNNEITYAYYTAGGMDITNGVTKGGTENVPTFTVTSDFAYASKTDTTNKDAVYFTDADKVATIKAVLLIGYDEKTFAPIEKTDEITITSTNAPTAVYTGEIKYTVTTAGGFIGKDSATKSDFAIGDDAKLQIILQKKNPDGSLSWLNSKDFGISKVEAGDENIVVVGTETALTNGNFGGYTITGIKEGTTNIILYTKNSAGKDEYFASKPVTVKAQRYAANIDLNVSKTNLNIDGTVGDSATLYATVYDQYGEWMDKYAGNITVDQAKDNDKSTGIVYGGNVINCNGTAVAKNWAIGGKPTNGSISITSADFSAYSAAGIPVKTGKSIFFALTESTKQIKRNYSITVLSATEADTNKWESSISNTALDTGLLTDELAGYSSNVKTAALKITKTYNGFYTGVETFTEINKRANELTWAQVQALDGGAAASGAAIYLAYPELDNNYGKFVTATGVGSTITTTASTAGAIGYTLTNIINNDQLTKGAYRFTFYRVERKAGGTTPTVSIVGTHNLTVTNNQKMPTITVKTDKISYTGAAPTLTDIKACFQADFGNNNKNINISNFTAVVSANGNVNVQKLFVDLPASCYGLTATKTIEVAVNKLLTKK